MHPSTRDYGTDLKKKTSFKLSRFSPKIRHKTWFRRYIYFKWPFLFRNLLFHYNSNYPSRNFVSPNRNYKKKKIFPVGFLCLHFEELWMLKVDIVEIELFCIVIVRGLIQKLGQTFDQLVRIIVDLTAADLRIYLKL